MLQTKNSCWIIKGGFGGEEDDCVGHPQVARSGEKTKRKRNIRTRHNIKVQLTLIEVVVRRKEQKKGIEGKNKKRWDCPRGSK